MRLMIIGPQGVGKGTQSVLLSEAIGVPHISTGDLFRSHASAQTELGRRAQEYMNAGELVPDAVTNAMVAERLTVDDTTNGYLLDGFPRTLDQARWFSQTLGPERDLQAVILLEAPQEELLQRMLARGRDDDRPEIIHRRLELYRTTTQPLLDHYANLLIPVNGSGAVADVHNRIIAGLTEQAGPAPAGAGEPADPTAASHPTTQTPLWPRPQWSVQ
jgi:adenylate kinase